MIKIWTPRDLPTVAWRKSHGVSSLLVLYTASIKKPKSLCFQHVYRHPGSIPYDGVLSHLNPVAGMRVMVHDEQGKLVDADDAVQFQKGWWEYTPKAAGKVSASAWDLPGNKVRTELVE